MSSTEPIAPPVDDRAVGVYIHVPFCVKKCVYCDFHSVIDADELIEPWVGAIVKEIATQSPMVGGRPVASVFFGGGTPSTLAPEQVAEIMEALRKNLRLAHRAEITMEMNPESITRDKAAGYLAAGVNRASVGAQALTDATLSFLGRVHTADDARRGVAAVREAGFANLSVDLIYGAPTQSDREWTETVREVAGWLPQHLSVYELTVERGTPLARSVAAGEVAFDDDGDRLYDAAEMILGAHSYVHYEISNYARRGFGCVHNIGYWEMRDYLGLGPGAHSLLDNTRWSNIKRIDTWIERTLEAGSAVADNERLTDGMRRTERLMMGLRLADGIPGSAVPITDKMRQAMDDGLLEIRGDRLRATPRGWRLLDDLLPRIV